jgi:5-formaminoimidazole-4-carboxamide-1-beta-D-ribofuranosyl 5'-monophosphate synthetase
MGPVSDDWPAVFSKQAVGRKIRSVYVPGRDFIIYVGTTNPANTPEVGHRSRLLSLASLDHRTEYKTWEAGEDMYPGSMRRGSSVGRSWQALQN